MSLGTGRNVFLDGNYMDISKISNDLWFANLPISSPSSKGTAVVRTAAGSTDDLDFKLASNSVVKLVEAGGNGSDYAEFTDDVKLTAGNDLFLDGLKVQATRVETFEATHYYEYAPLGDQALGLDWRVPADYNGWTITAFSIVVGYNSCTNNIQGQLALNGGSNFATRNITPGNTSSELTTVNQAVATGDVLNIKLANGTAGLVKNGARFSITLKKT
jgi:hypothetical protein